MKFEYTGRHVDVTPAIRQHVEDHFGKLSDLFDDSTARAHIRIEVEKNRHVGEVMITWRDHTLTAKDVNDDMYQALTRAIDKIEKQALKLKKKIIERSQSASRAQAAELTTAPDVGTTIDQVSATEVARAAVAGRGTTGNENADGADDDAGREPRIIQTDLQTLKPMTPEEAMLRLADEPDQFLVFRDAETERIGVLYKRRDGNYGLIEP